MAEWLLLQILPYYMFVDFGSNTFKNKYFFSLGDISNKKVCIPLHGHQKYYPPSMYYYWVSLNISWALVFRELGM